MIPGLGSGDGTPTKIRWHRNSDLCSHEGDNVCPFCDFDGYYERTYPGCPWAVTP